MRKKEDGFISTIAYKVCFNSNESNYVCVFRRTDRQDMMTLIGGYLNLELTKMDGVRTHLALLS